MKFISRLILLLVPALVVPGVALWAQSYNISAFAGGSLPPLPESALAVSIGGQFTGVASDTSGNIYVADQSGELVYEVSAAGTINLVAGTGHAGYSGDGGPAVSAELRGPEGVAVDATGAVYIADSGNYRIRKVVNGVISTIAGNGVLGDSGDGGPATQAEIGVALIFGIALDTSGNLYINEFSNIRKVSTTGIISTVAGVMFSSGDSGDGGPAVSAEITSDAIAIDLLGNIYIADGVDCVIREISTTGIINTIAGNHTSGYSGDGGPALSAQFDDPTGIAVDSNGNILIADSNNARIRKINPAGIVTSFAGIGLAGFSGDGGPATNAALNDPESVATGANGSVLIEDTGNRRVRQVASSGVIATVAGDGFINEAGDGGPAVTAQFLFPSAVLTTSSGAVYLGDGGNNVVREVTPAGIVTRVAGNGTYGYSGDGGPAIDAELIDANG